jgi:hypothetical protein
MSRQAARRREDRIEGSHPLREKINRPMGGSASCSRRRPSTAPPSGRSGPSRWPYDATRRVTRALADSGDVLGVEQRRKLEERLDEWRERRAFWRWHRG